MKFFPAFKQFIPRQELRAALVVYQILYLGRLIMAALIAIGITVGIFGLLNIIDFKRLD